MLELLRGLADLLLPPCCAGCGGGVEVDSVLCRTCDAALPRVPPRAGDACALCGVTARLSGPGGRRCPACVRRPATLAACAAAVEYAGEAERWVRRFKYPAPGLRGLDPAPGAVVRSWIRQAGRGAPPPAPSLVVPVPLHPRRLRRRGFNPAAQLARELARSWGAACDPVALARVRDTPSQTGLDRRARARNVARAFRPRPGLRLPRRVALVDDVVTTGATLDEAARALRRAGARRVIAVCAARTPAGR